MKINMLHENDRVKIFVDEIENKKNILIGVVGRYLVVWDKKIETIKLPFRAGIIRKSYENNGLKIILKRQ